MPIRRGKTPPSCAVIAGFLVLVPVLGCVSAESFRLLEQRSHAQETEIARARKERDALAEELRKQQGALRVDLAELQADLDEVRSEIQRLGGQVSLREYREEEAARTSEAMGESLVLQVSNLQREMHATQSRIGRVEDFFGLKQPGTEAGAPKAGRPASAPPPPEVPPRTGPSDPPAEPQGADDRSFTQQEAYEAAYRLFKAGQFRNAREAFERFIELNPQSSLVDNALFWIGETHYRSEDFPSAILRYEQVLERFPNGSKVPDAMLKMGYALEKIQEPQAAAAILDKLVKDHPQSPQAGLASKKIRQLTPAKTDEKRDRGNEVNPNPQDAAQENKPPK